MKVKYKNRWYDVLDTKKYFGSTFYAIESNSCDVKWFKDTDIEKTRIKL